jgi:hypothetical protein
MKGKVWGYRADDNPLVESEETKYSIILTQFKNKPEIGEEIEFEITQIHGFCANARRVDDVGGR